MLYMIWTYKLQLNIDLKIDDISYKKTKENKASLQINGYKAEEKVFFNKISYVEHNNKIEIINLELNDNKIIYVDNIKLNYLTNNNCIDSEGSECDEYPYDNLWNVEILTIL